MAAGARTGEERDGVISPCADGAVLAGRLAAGGTGGRWIAPGMRAYLVPSTGRIRVNGVTVGPRDGAAVQDEGELVITADEPAELMMVETVESFFRSK